MSHADLAATFPASLPVSLVWAKQESESAARTIAEGKVEVKRMPEYYLRSIGMSSCIDEAGCARRRLLSPGDLTLYA